MWCAAPASMAEGAAELPTQAALHQNMDSPSPTGGLFDIVGSKHDPPDFLEIDPDLLSTLSSPRRISTDSLNDSTTTDTAMMMMDNWQMNEVFQDISDILTEPETDAINDNDDAIKLATQSNGNEDELNDLLKDVFIPTSPLRVGPASAEQTELVEASLLNHSDAASSAVDLSWIIQQTLGDEVGTEQAVTAAAAEPDVPPHRVSVEEYDLLSQLELMANGDEAPADETASCSAAVNIDHHYTQLADVQVKPHETKKQAIRRVKNNAASRVCRRQRKNRLTTNMDRVKELVASNDQLRQRLSEIEGVVSLLKEHLVKATRK